MTRRLAHPLGEQRLAEHVVDLVRAGVVEVLALEQDPRAAGVLGEPRHLGDRAGPAGVVALQPVELGEERRVDPHGLVGLGQLVERGDQRLGHEPAAEDAEVAGGVGPARTRRQETSPGGGELVVRQCPAAPPRAAHRVGVSASCAAWPGASPPSTRSATAWRGSPAVTRPSPTSTASAPARGVADQVVRAADAGLGDLHHAARAGPGAIRSKVERSTSRVRQVAGVDADHRGAGVDSARSASASVCTSTSAVMPSDSTRSSRPTRAFCSSAATISSTTSAPCARASCTW